MTRAKKLKSDTCLLPGCEKKLSAKWHFCREHWALVPDIIQRAVTKTWEMVQVKEPFNSVANDHRMNQWRLARGVAIVSVQEALGQITISERKKEPTNG